MCLIQTDPLMDFEPSMPSRNTGEVLLTDYLQRHAISLARLARGTGIPLPMLRQIILGRRRISAEQALRLSRLLDATPVFWLVLQARHDLAGHGESRLS
ncbi:HigA family addiction module antitoxin [Dyella sp. C9]|uniref:HigA family addiction module antitoxin n=1 Tax=Dyella sp. C9 TaxID=2202154 RepID=UPI000DEEC29D|nr:HigA family addiction module antitoxin [Dyella sp. C9]